MWVKEVWVTGEKWRKERHGSVDVGGDGWVKGLQAKG